MKIEWKDRWLINGSIVDDFIHNINIKYPLVKFFEEYFGIIPAINGMKSAEFYDNQISGKEIVKNWANQFLTYYSSAVFCDIFNNGKSKESMKKAEDSYKQFWEGIKNL